MSRVSRTVLLLVAWIVGSGIVGNVTAAREPSLPSREVQVNAGLSTAGDVVLLTAIADEKRGEVVALVALHSSDGGESFGPATSLSLGGRKLARGTESLSTDGDGNVWASWLTTDGSGQAVSISRSTDGGATFAAPFRADRKQPWGSYDNAYQSCDFDRQPTAALPGVGLVAWAGQRTSPRYDLLINADDVSDGDGDGFARDDCDDGNAATHPGAPEVNDALDNQCVDDRGFGLVDEIGGDVVFTDVDRLEWTAQVGAGSYEVMRADSPIFDAGCQSSAVSDPEFVDSAIPAAGELYSYLVGAISPNVGSWGADGNGAERVPRCADQAKLG